jgi:drug/metabolite transporter (DMT)-like permease
MSSLAQTHWTSPIPRSLFYCLFIQCACTVVFAPLVIRKRGWRAIAGAGIGEFWRATAASAVSVLGYTLILKALETASVSYVVAVRQSSVLFALLLGVFWLRERPGRIRVIGAGTTVIGVALISLTGGN